jgi:hypothetical protein
MTSSPGRRQMSARAWRGGVLRNRIWLAAGVNAAISAESVPSCREFHTTDNEFCDPQRVRGHSFLVPDRTIAFLNIKPPTSGCLRGMPGEGPRVPDRAQGPWPRNPGIHPRRRQPADRSRPTPRSAAPVRHRGGIVLDRIVTAALCAQTGLDRWANSSQTGMTAACGRPRPTSSRRTELPKVTG